MAHTLLWQACVARKMEWHLHEGPATVAMYVCLGLFLWLFNIIMPFPTLPLLIPLAYFTCFPLSLLVALQHHHVFPNPTSSCPSCLYYLCCERFHKSHYMSEPIFGNLLKPLFFCSVKCQNPKTKIGNLLPLSSAVPAPWGGHVTKRSTAPAKADIQESVQMNPKKIVKRP